MKKGLIGGALAGALLAGAALAQSILPNGQTQIADSNGAPLAGGSVYFYIPGTTTPKTTYVDPGLTTPNTNPVLLNAGGRMIAWGEGQYREVVYDVNGTLIWDQITSGETPASGGGSAPLGGFGPRTSIASSSTVDLGTVASHNAEVTGTVSITSFGSSASTSAPYYFACFDSGLVIVYNLTTMVIPGQSDLRLHGQDCLTAMYLGSGNWQIVSVQRGSGQTVSGTGPVSVVASNSTADLGLAASNLVEITGTTTIASFGSSAELGNPIYDLTFDDALTLTNSASLALPGGQDLGTSAGTYARAQYLGSGNWRVLTFTNAGASASGFQAQRFTTVGAGTWTIPAGITTSTVFKLTVIGGGGGGGAASASAPNSGGAGGGGAGSQYVGLVSGFTAGGTLSFVIGDLGAGSGSTGTPGGTGDDTVVTWSSTNFIDASGGVGGNGAASGSSGTGGAGGAVTTNFAGAGLTQGTVVYGGAGNSSGAHGQDGQGTGGVWGGAGGSTIWGYGAPSTSCASGSGGNTGYHGIGFGAGGAGGCANTSGTGNGGDGSQGELIIEWTQ